MAEPHMMEEPQIEAVEPRIAAVEVQTAAAPRIEVAERSIAAVEQHIGAAQHHTAAAERHIAAAEVHPDKASPVEAPPTRIPQQSPAGPEPEPQPAKGPELPRTPTSHNSHKTHSQEPASSRKFYKTCFQPFRESIAHFTRAPIMLKSPRYP